MAESLRKHKDESWDFRDADTKEFTHCFHSYPAMMCPQIARELLKRYGTQQGWLLDPYCGTGTSLVEATLFGMRAVGCDINPLARLIATAKIAVPSLRTIDLYLRHLNDHLFELEFGSPMPSATPPEFPNRDYWFAPDVTQRLAYLREYIRVIDDETIKNFLWVAFAETVRECSYTRNGEFKLFRMTPSQIDKFQPNVFNVFRSKLARNRKGLADYLAHRRAVVAFVSDANTAEGELPEQRPLKGFDLIITSPPYGDSSTTVAYGQFSRLAAEWIGLAEARTVDRNAMGGRIYEEGGDLGCVNEPIARIGKVDTKRARQVVAFYADLKLSIDTVASILARHAVVCYVVGNRRVKGVTLPTDEFVVRTFSKHGLRHEETIIRNIPNKRMPSRNSPSNVTGETDVTMTEEYIVICQR